MVWNESTPEYQAYIKYPRVAGGQHIGSWFCLDKNTSINIAHIVSVEKTPDGCFIVTVDGSTFPGNEEAYQLWMKVTTISPAEAERVHMQNLQIARANGPIPLR